MRRDWESLSVSYRDRLERNGITRSAYESGQSLSVARGHGHTPEHPQSGYNRPEYREYHERRQVAERKMVQLKKDKWGDSPTWSDIGARKSAERMSMATLNTITAYDSLDDYFDDMLYEEEEPDSEANHYHE